MILVAAAMLVAEPIAAARTPDSTPQQPTAAITLPAGTPLRLKAVGPINSRVVRQGQRFALELADDVIVSSSVAIPRGTPAVGEVEAVSGTGMFGKAARLVLRPLFVEVGGQRVNLVGMTSEKGKDATAGAAVTTAVFGAFGLIITGKSATMPAGSVLLGHVRSDVTLIPAY